ncbi:MAG: CsiV family protein [Methyloprofundus sp.]|nr:CsiV family protein [Methyloprofundus sp.]
MSQYLKLVCFLVLLGLQGAALADMKTFNIEVIAFKQSAPNSEVFEQTESEIEAVRRYSQGGRGRQTMSSLYRRLDKSVDYQPFYYNARQVQAKSGRLSLPVEIYDAGEKLTGWVKIQRSELLHVLADVELSPSDSVEEDGLIYHLKEKRRVLLKEIHYLDHPKFGLIVKVSPVK